MLRLKQRSKGDSLQNQPRRRRQGVVRALYLGSLLAMCLWLGDLFIGGLFYFRSEGLVIGEPAIIAAEFPVTVRSLTVREGEEVKMGDVAAVVSSQSVVENIARLTTELAARETRVSELRIRNQTVDALIGLAADRRAIAVHARREFEKLLERGYLPLDKRTAAVESEFRSQQDLHGLQAEKRVIEEELANLGRAFAEAKGALLNLHRLYDDGKLRAPIDGIVSRLLADKGSVVRAGDPLIEVYGNQRYVLAYVPTGALYDVEIGDRVRIETGLRMAEGFVVRVEPFAAAVPREFQRAFTPVDRQQVIRVEFMADETPPPLFTKVKLRSADLVPRWIREAVKKRFNPADWIAAYAMH